MLEMEMFAWILAIIGFAIAGILGAAWAIRNALRSKVGKILDRAKVQHKPLVLAASLGHHAKLYKVNEIFPGMLETVPFRKRNKQKRKVFGAPAYAEVEIPEAEIKAAKERQLTQQCLDAVLKLNTEKVFLEDGVPITLALDDRVITTGIKGIGALAYFEKLCKIDSIKDKITALKKQTDFKEIAEYLEKLASQISIINIDVLRNWFDADYSQGDAEHQNEFYYVQGYRDNQKGEHSTEKIFIYGGIAIGIVGCVMGALFAFLG